EAEGLGRLSCQMRKDVGRELRGLRLGELRGRWAHLAIERVNDRGAITRGPNAAHAGYRHVRVDDQSAATLHRRYGLEERVRLCRDRAYARAAGENFPRFELHVTIGNTQRSGAETHVDVAATHLAQRKLAKPRREFR